MAPDTLHPPTEPLVSVATIHRFCHLGWPSALPHAPAYPATTSPFRRLPPFHYPLSYHPCPHILPEGICHCLLRTTAQGAESVAIPHNLLIRSRTPTGGVCTFSPHTRPSCVPLFHISSRPQAGPPQTKSPCPGRDKRCSKGKSQCHLL